MKKIILSLVMAVMLVSLIAVPVFAAGKSAPAGKSDMGSVYLYEKDADADWAIVPGGAWGKYNYKLSGTGDDTAISGVFNGHGLAADTEYSLIYYPEVADNPWTTNPEVVVIGTGTANEYGDVHIAGSGEIGFPDEQPLIGDYVYQFGDKIWLVLSDDLTAGGVFNAWNPDSYLFEDELINTALGLYQKDSSWLVVDGGAYGFFDYTLSKGGKATEVSGVFNGYGLVAGEAYSLIYYPEVVDNPWTTYPEVVVIGTGTAFSTAVGVEISIADCSGVIGQPDEQPTGGDYEGMTGDKIWLVLSSDLTETEGVVTMTGWNPDSYLFEVGLINTGK